MTLTVNAIHTGDARDLLPQIERDSVALSVWSPPYHVGKSYEKDMTFDEWQNLLRDVIALHQTILKPGGFLAINIADILCFRDESMPKIQALAPNRRRHAIATEDVLRAKRSHPDLNRYQLAALLGVSEQTIDRRLNGNNIRGGKHATQTRVKIVGGSIEEMGLDAGLYMYDRRVWVKDAAWENSRWASLSYRAVDEFEYVFIFWKPGITKVDRSRLTRDEWSEWGSRAVWSFPSVRSNNIHEAMFPVELPRRCIRLLTDPGDVVLDCFMGSGTTALAAVETGRDYIGIELFEEYACAARELVALAPSWLARHGRRPIAHLHDEAQTTLAV
jgi:DNA modification methylase